MEHHPLNVLLLGWDEAAQAPEPDAPGTLELSRHLTEHLPVSVIVPRLPDSATLTSADQIIRLNLLSAAQLAAAAVARPAASAGSWQAPAAPYAGASPQNAPASHDPAAPAVAPPATTPATAPGQPTPAVPTDYGLLNEDEFAEATAETGPDEAADMHQAADNLTPDAPAESAAPATTGSQPVAAPPTAAQAAAQASFVQALQSLDGEADGPDLNFRVIQYARFATPLAVSQPFGVVYATSWPAWLAAMEIRQLTGRPLVLHVQSLAVDRDSPADRGWILELERLALRRADLILAHTEELAQRLTSVYLLPATRIRVVDANDTAAINDALTHVTPRA